MQKLVAQFRPAQRSTKLGAVVGTSFALYSAYQMYSMQGLDHVQLAHANDAAAHQVFGWGSCIKGQLGIGKEMAGLSMPTMITDLDGQEVVCLSAMSEKSSAVNNFGELLTWGSVKNRSMLDAQGNPYKDNLKLPTLFATEDLVFNSVSVGKEHIAAITKDGKLFTMGTEDHGKLGHDPKVISKEEAEKEAERYKKAGYRPAS